MLCVANRDSLPLADCSFSVSDAPPQRPDSSRLEPLKPRRYHLPVASTTLVCCDQKTANVCNFSHLAFSGTKRCCDYEQPPIDVIVPRSSIRKETKQQPLTPLLAPHTRPCTASPVLAPLTKIPRGGYLYWRGGSCGVTTSTLLPRLQESPVTGNLPYCALAKYARTPTDR